MRNNKGFVWLIVLLVIAVVIGIIMTKRGGDETTGTDTTTETGTPVSNISPATPPAPTPSPTPAKTTTKATTPTPAPAPSMTASGSYIVRYYASGFSPAKLTISVGKSIHFVNSAQAAMQINPVDGTNAPYASFRQSKSVGTGGTFDYTFTQRGVYGYYNANNKSHVGIITVQ